MNELNELADILLERDELWNMIFLFISFDDLIATNQQQ